MLKRYAFRCRANGVGFRGSEFGIGTVNTGNDRVPLREASDKRADPLDGTSHVGADNGRKLQGPHRLHQTLADFPVDRIDPGRPYPDQYAIRTDVWNRRILVCEDGRVAILVNTNSFHRVSPILIKLGWMKNKASKFDGFPRRCIRGRPPISYRFL